jgi:hypothetical protein
LDKKLDVTELEPFLEEKGFDKKLPEFLTEIEERQMAARSKLFFETLWKVMGRK